MKLRRKREGIYMKRDRADDESNGEDNRKKDKIRCDIEVACEGANPQT